MRNKKKIVIGIVSILLILTIGGLGFVGNYFFNYALVRQEGIVTAANVDEKAPQSEKLDVEKINKEKSKKEVDKWTIIAHGNSEGQYIGMGWLDRKDMLKWIDYVISLDKNAQIALYGESMGGATVMMTSGEDLPSNVKAIVEDCGYTSVLEMFKKELNERFGLKPFPILNAAEVVTQLRAKYNFTEASALEQVKKSKTPMLFTHGDNDTYVPTKMVYELYEAANVEKDMLIIDGASHGAAPDVDPETYYEKVFSFLDKYIK